MRWGYTFESEGNGTRATESWQVLPAYPDFVSAGHPNLDVKARIDGMAQMARDGIKDTLANLKRVRRILSKAGALFRSAVPARSVPLWSSSARRAASSRRLRCSRPSHARAHAPGHFPDHDTLATCSRVSCSPASSDRRVVLHPRSLGGSDTASGASSCRSNLPTELRGNRSRNVTDDGTSCAARRARQNSSNSSSLDRRAGCEHDEALAVSVVCARRRRQRPRDALRAHVRRHPGTRCGPTPRTHPSTRSTIQTNPSSSIRAASPVRSHPCSSIASRVASGRFQ